MNVVAEKAFTVEWHDSEKTIQIVTMNNCDWTWYDFSDAIQEQVRIAQTVDHAVHVLFDFSVCPKFPRKGLLARLPGLMTTSAGNEELIILVKANPIFITMIKTAGKIFNLNSTLSGFLFVDSIELAYMEIDAYQRNTPL